ncbi:CarD family transcriptional regulator [Oceanobacillus alkalisoli]|uniref:CarD family transcriptional regulator n=1 Tax=Oceanobacillus alkalisoli TaxID=2925113 RepID=UPI001EF12E1D|nr:CarD family transcriptional regulator [Oceanobacillus alkalisoli]MCF3944846.1 CarD family transcriptional regulator [Oceanobacillus alkalisoli]MCG5104769.1 CarD family transcriptional regulator [Oceanobacillus alkalisoli]
MFKVGDLIIYSTHGVCKIDDICERSYRDETREYYILHPMEDPNLTISVPVDNEKVVMLDIMEKQEAKTILDLFEEPGIEWIEDAKQRNKKYNSLINGGDRDDIVKIANTLMRKQKEAKVNKERMYDQDQKMLEEIQRIMFQELAASLDTTVERIIERINKVIPSKVS